MKLRKWDRNWADPQFDPPWQSDGNVAPVRAAVAEGWWKPGATVLDIGCGDGRIAASLADQGFRVVGVDFSRAAIARAKRLHAGHDRLAFAVVDVSAAGAIGRKFDALLDRGCMHCLDVEKYGDYSRNVARWCKPGARFLLLIHQLEMSYQARVDQIMNIFGADFELLSHEPVSLERQSSSKAIPGIAFRLQRRSPRQALDSGVTVKAQSAPALKVETNQRKRIPAGKRRRLNETLDAHPHWCHPLTDPDWVEGAKAEFMRAEDPVLGYFAGGAAWALPWWVMKNHHVANLTLNSQPVLVVLCELCSSAGAFDPVIDGRRHNFRFGGLFNGTVMPEDDETKSLWGGFNGTAIEGPLVGRVMERLPLLQCTWSEWMEMHPDTLVTDAKNESREGHGEGHSPGSPVVTPFMAQLLAFLDSRLPYYELVLGVLSGGKSRCYPLSALGRHGSALNDELGGKEIAIFSRPGTWMAFAFSRQVDDQLLTFHEQAGNILDLQTGSQWNISGRATAGALMGRQLQYLHSGVEEFFLWAAFNPETGVYGQADVPASRLPALAILEAIPAAVRTALESEWIPAKSRILILGAGIDNGMSAALVAERGAHVVAVDTSAAAIEKARRTFRGVVRLQFKVADLCQRTDLGGPFAAVIDRGFFASLSASQRPVFVTILAAMCGPGARLLLLSPLPAAKLEHRRARMVELFAPSFRLQDAKMMTLPDAAGAAGLPAAEFRFVRA